MPASALALLIGTLLPYSLNDRPSTMVAAVACLLSLLLLPWRQPWLTGLAGVLFGAGWTLLQADQILDRQLPPELEGRDVLVEGVIASLPEKSGRASRFLFQTSQLSFAGSIGPDPGRIRLSWYGRPPARLQAGDRWRLLVRLKRPRGLLNPGGFDYEQWLFSERIRARGYVRHSHRNQRLAQAGNITARLARWRQQIRERLQEHLGESPFAGIIVALAIGDRSAIDADQWQRLRQTGTSHLVAISGLHIGLVAALAIVLGRWLWSRSARLCEYWPATQAAAVWALLAATGYAALAGFSLPTQRALWMITVAVCARLLHRQLATGQILSLALLAVLLLDPLSPLNPGFWLSFAAVTLILLLSRHRPRRRRRQWLTIHLLLALGLTPLLIGFFQQTSLVAPLANLVAVPAVTFVIVPLILAAVLLLGIWPGLSGYLLNLADSALTITWRWLTLLGELPGGAGLFAAPPIWTLAIAMAGILLLFLPRGMPGRWLGLLALLPLFLVQGKAPKAGEYLFTLLDVGQGLAAVIETSDHVLVYDSGPRYSDRFNAGSDIIIPYLRQRGIKQIDTLIIGHGDADHIGGARGLFQGIRIDRILSSVPDELPWSDARPCLAGQRWQWDGVPFQVLHPAPETPLSGNDASCVIRIGHAPDGILLSGDIEQAAEKRLLRRARPLLAAKVLVAPHHGSATSSTEPFIAAVAPRYTLFAVGYGNRFGLPRVTIIRRYRRHGIRCLDSAGSGAIRIRFMPDGQIADVRRWRQQKAVFWRSTRHFRGDRTIQYDGRVNNTGQQAASEP